MDRDHPGSHRQDGGAVVSEYGYDVFGTIRTQSGGSANPWLFIGEQRDVRQTVTKTSYCQLLRRRAQDERLTRPATSASGTVC